MSAPGGQSGSDGSDAAAKALAVARLGIGVAGGGKIALAIGIGLFIAVMFLGVMVAASGSSPQGGVQCVVVGKGGDKIPANYVPWLEKAATKYKLGPKGLGIVAAIHKVESDFGRSPLPGVKSGTNFAGAAGPGQFLLQYWPFYGVDGDGDGEMNVYSVPDSVMATAHHQRLHGAPDNWHDSIFAYNHAEWYVEKVLREAEGFEGKKTCTAAQGALGSAPSDTLGKIEYYARWIERKRIPYCWGGGHGPKPGPDSPCGYEGLDCSGSVRWLLVLSGVPDPGGISSGGFPSAFTWGPGKHVTIWSNAGHVFIEINGRMWGTSSSNPAGGPGYADHTTLGFIASHPEGL